jgi:Leucine-rich repeat (LRR) protein
LNLKTANFLGILHFSLGKLTNLIEIHLGLTNFTLVAIPSWFVSFTKLKVLDLSSSNFIEGPILEWVQMMQSLQYLNLAYCNLTDQILGFLGGLTTLQTLWLKGNLLNGSIPNIFANLTKFMSFDVSQN